MDNWTKLTTSISGLNLGSNAGKLAKGFSSSVQATRERLGQVSVEDITELPQEYKDLEARVDALKAAHDQMLKIISVYQTPYDYPTQIQESLSEFGSTISTGWASFAATNLKGTNLPVPAATPPTPKPAKTLPHAIARASASAGRGIGPNDRLGKALSDYAVANEEVGEARLEQDATIEDKFVLPWQTTLNTGLALAMNARQAVKTSRLNLDAVKQTLKNATGARQEQVRLEVENAEDDLVQKTESAIQQMKVVLENPEPLNNLNQLVTAQLKFHAAAVAALQACQPHIEELSIQAEGDFRRSHGQ